MAKKRANGEGTIRQMPNGNWQIQYMDGWKPDGRKNVKTFTAKTLTAAKKKMNAYIKKKEAGLLTGEDMRFDDWADTWFEYHKNVITPTTQEGYTYTLRVLKEYFGRYKIAEIKTYDIEVFLLKLKQNGASASRIIQCRSMLSQILRKAVANDLISKNPADYLDKMRKGAPKRKEAFTADEVRRLMKELSEDKIGWSIRLMLCTGMRTQELLGLEPRHIAKEGSFINIEQAVVMEKGTAVIGTPKSRDSYRTIPVPEIARYCARLLRDTDKKFIWETGRMDMPCNPSYFRKQFKQALGAVEGIRVLTPHCCRHTYVSQMQALGVSLETIQNIVGHADVDMTKHYLHVQEPARQDAIKRFNDAFSNRGSGVHGNILDYVKSS